MPRHQTDRDAFVVHAAPLPSACAMASRPLMRMRASRRPSEASLTCWKASLLPLCTASDTLATNAFSESSKLCRSAGGALRQRTPASRHRGASRLEEEGDVLDESVARAHAPWPKRLRHQAPRLLFLLLHAQVQQRQRLHQAGGGRRVLPRERLADLHRHHLHRRQDRSLHAARLEQLQQRQRRLAHRGRQLAVRRQRRNLTRRKAVRGECALYVSEQPRATGWRTRNAPSPARQATRRRRVCFR